MRCRLFGRSAYGGNVGREVGLSLELGFDDFLEARQRHFRRIALHLEPMDPDVVKPRHGRGRQIGARRHLVVQAEDRGGPRLERQKFTRRCDARLVGICAAPHEVGIKGQAMLGQPLLEPLHPDTR